MTDGAVGVVGLGAMGLPIANALTTRGPVLAYDAAAAPRSRASSAGIPVAGSLVELAQSCNTVLLSLPAAGVVEEVVAELAPAAPGLLLLDTSTIGPEDSRRIGALALAAGSTYLDTPILGRPEMVGSWTVPVGVRCRRMPPWPRSSVRSPSASYASVTWVRPRRSRSPTT